MRIFILACFSCISSAFSQDLSLLYQKGVQHHRKEQYDSAYVVFKQVKEKGLWNDEVASYLGSTAYHLSDTAQALSYFSKAIALNPLNKRALFDLGILYYDREDLDSALFYLNKLISIDPKNYDAYNNRGLIYYDLKQFDKSKEDFIWILKGGQKVERVYYNLAKTEHALQDLKAALKHYNKAILLDSTDYNAFMNRGNVYIDLNNYPKAIADYNASYKINANNPLLYLNRGKAYQEMTHYQEAISDYSVYLKYDPRNAICLQLRGENKLFLQDTSGCKDLRTSIDLGNKEAQSVFNEKCDD